MERGLLSLKVSIHCLKKQNNGVVGKGPYSVGYTWVPRKKGCSSTSPMMLILGLELRCGKRATFY